VRLRGDAEAREKDALAAQARATQPIVAGQSERFKLWIEVSTGQELDADTGRIRVLDLASWDARRRRRGELGGPIFQPDR
jgi:hypothetical protein